MMFFLKLIKDVCEVYVQLFFEAILYLKSYKLIYILYTYYTFTDALWFLFSYSSKNKLWLDYIKNCINHKTNDEYIKSKNERILEYSRFIKNIPYSQIIDNTEGIAAFQDLFFWSNSTLLLDIGSGKNYREIKRWIEKTYPKIRYLGIDPYECSREHNERVQQIVEANGGVDIVTSMSVLNIIPSTRERLQHIQLVYSLLHYQCPAYFKIWAGNYPFRGTGIQTKTCNYYQNNKWAHEYTDEIEYVFGKDKYYVDCEKNLIIAYK